MSIAAILSARARNRVWAEKNRQCKVRKHWVAATPPFGAYLPGGVTSVTFDPRPRWPMQLRNARGLHGAITTLLDRGHGRWPAWALFPCADGWSIYWSRDEDASRFASKRIQGALWDEPTVFGFGPLFRMRVPSGPSLGRRKRRLRIDAITPIVTRSSGGKTPCVRPTDDTIRGSLDGELLYRLSPTHSDASPGQDAWTQWTRPRVMVHIVEHGSEPVYTDCGGPLRQVAGWQGHVIVEANAVAHWLLTLCERGIGLGGRTAYGFGRIRVTPC